MTASTASVARFRPSQSASPRAPGWFSRIRHRGAQSSLRPLFLSGRRPALLGPADAIARLDSSVSVRLRFAPSPTGYLHVGGARTALFNWLYARRHGGTFVLRIEDTDVERSSADMVTGILDEHALARSRLGRRSGRRRAARAVLSDRAARSVPARGARARRVRPRVSLLLQARGAEGEARRRAGRRIVVDVRPHVPHAVARPIAPLARRPAPSHAIRFLVPDGRTSFDDLVHGAIDFDHANIEDFVVLRSDGYPTYHLSVVVDDVEMEITHVVRGDDHISNTPKQVLIYRAMDAPVPAFAHVPLILGPDKKRLSKRHGATSVGEYEKQGYLPEAMVNFLALLGWSPGSDEELFTRDELIARFSLEGISGGNAVFNPEKLDWFNQQHIMRLSGRGDSGAARSRSGGGRPDGRRAGRSGARRRRRSIS